MGIFWQQFHRLIRHPLTTLVIGLLLVIAGLWELVALWLEGEEASHGVGGHHGVVVLGVLNVIVAMEDLVSGSQSTLVFFSKTGDDQSKAGLLGRIVASPWFQILLGILVLGAGFAEGAIGVIEVVETREHANTSVWHFGVILIGLMALLNGLAAFIESMEFFSDRGGDWRYGLLRRIRPALQHPAMECCLAAAVFILAVWEDFLGTKATSIGAHHGMMIYALRSFVTSVPDFFFSLGLVDKAHSDEVEIEARKENGP
jgi:hypothetical protein